MSTPGYPGNPNDPYASGPQPQAGYGQQPGYASSPAYGQPGYQQPGYPSGGFQQPYPGQPGPAGYGQYPPPQYGAGYPGYGQPAKAGRPGMVTAAAVLAFVWGGLGILFSIFGLLAGSVLSTASSAVCNSRHVLRRRHRRGLQRGERHRRIPHRHHHRAPSSSRR